MHRVATGVRGIKLRDGDYAVDMGLVEEGKELLSITENGYGKRTVFDEYRQQNRGGMGIIAMRLNEKTGKMVGLKPVDDENDIMIISSDGTIIRMEASGITTIGRATQGVKVMRLRDNDKVVAFEAVEREDSEAGVEESTDTE